MIHISEYLEQLKLIWSGAKFFIFNGKKYFFPITQIYILITQNSENADKSKEENKNKPIILSFIN